MEPPTTVPRRAATLLGIQLGVLVSLRVALRQRGERVGERQNAAGRRLATARRFGFVVARSAFGGLVSAVAVPPAARLQGSVAEFLKEQLRSARATASGARADRMAKALRKVGELEWALEQSGASRAPAVVSQVATSTESVQVCEVTEAARLIDQIDPLWLSVLLPARSRRWLGALAVWRAARACRRPPRP